MLRVSATQELARKLEAKDPEIAALKQQLADKTAKDTAQDEQLAALTRLLEAGNLPANVSTVSTSQ